MSAYAADEDNDNVLAATTSWIGNTFGYGHGMWTQIDITSIAVSPDGKVYTNSPWDESGAEASVYQNGKQLEFAGGTHGWGRSGGEAVAINSRYVFVGTSVGNERGKLVADGVWPPTGEHWFGISRRDLASVKKTVPFRAVARADAHGQLAAGFLPVNRVSSGTKAPIYGLAASETTVYASNTTRDEIDVIDAESMQQKSAWKVHEPGRIALAPDGTLWVLTDSLSGSVPRLAHYTADGKQLSDKVALPQDAVPVDIAVDKKGRLYVADNGWRQQVLIFTASHPGQYELTDTFGERYGIWAGKPSEQGRPGPMRFNGLTGVGVDAGGNIYVSMNGVGPQLGSTGAGLGATLASYTPDGKPRWQVDGLLFVDGACIDPSRPNSVFTGNKRFELDWSKPPGHEWKYAGFLSNRFKYPEDTVFHMDQWPGTPMARQLNGRTFLYLTDMYADHLKIYRFDPAHDGETAIPSGFIAGRPGPVHAITTAPPGGEWIWRNANGDGKFNPQEFQRNSTDEHLAGGWGWWVDAKGDIWRANDTRIHRLRFGGVDRSGNPIYAYDKMTTYAIPAPFKFVKRAVYDTRTDSLYVTGYTDDAMPNSNDVPKEIGRVLARYDGWSTGKPVLRFTTQLLWQPKGKERRTLVSVTQEGDYVFAVEFIGIVHVFDRNTGAQIGVIKPGPEVGNASGHVDVANAISAYKRANGEYVVFVEEDARGKVLMYRWTPAAGEKNQGGKKGAKHQAAGNGIGEG
ncbi:hypothetical protein [Paraburkholderia sp. NMBU_R16]|uniref:hypothetical protein n=1 Tax=Paraburkholderia sp. NMBU_R16 TaxID=2698676 RepID=UPI0020B78AF6|nr:hypothetical protein [Paraburkholderia sp. NMBU_R16]